MITEHHQGPALIPQTFRVLDLHRTKMPPEVPPGNPPEEAENKRRDRRHLALKGHGVMLRREATAQAYATSGAMVSFALRAS